jgi:uncharacterized protein YndB with AHSA1/START domain
MPNAIHQEVEFMVPPGRVYEALLDAKQFSQFSGGAPAEIDAREGGTFSCFGGMITGRNIELRGNQRIVQAWRAGGQLAGRRILNRAFRTLAGWRRLEAHVHS